MRYEDVVYSVSDSLENKLDINSIIIENIPVESTPGFEMYTKNIYFTNSIIILSNSMRGFL